MRADAHAWIVFGLVGVLVFGLRAFGENAPPDARTRFVEVRAAGRLDLERGGNVSGEVIVTCDQPGRFSVALSAGIDGYGLRKMRGADGSELVYNLFVDPGRRRVWGDGVSAGTQTVRGESDGRRPLVIPVYGLVPPRQSVLTGAYSDNLLVTVENL